MQYHDLADQARQASRVVAQASMDCKNRALEQIGVALDSRRDEVLAANQNDLKIAADSGLEAALLDRLELNTARVDSMIEGVNHQSAGSDRRDKSFDKTPIRN